MKYAHSILSFDLLRLYYQIPLDSYDLFTHIIQSSFTGIGALAELNLGLLMLLCNDVFHWLGASLELNCIRASDATQGLYSLSGKTSYRQISWSLEAARLDVAIIVSFWNLTGTSAAAVPRYLSNFRAIGKV